jgi:hypothetical protein
MLSITEVAGRIFVGIVFVFSAAGKSRPTAFKDFVASLLEFGVEARGARSALALLVLTLEWCVAGAVCMTQSSAAALVLAAGLVTCFSVASVRALRSGRQPACSCFGRRKAEIGRSTLARNCVIIAVAVVGALCSGDSERMLSSAQLVIGIGIGAIPALSVVAWNDLASLLRARPVSGSPVQS